MHTQGLIDEVIAYYDNVSSADAENAQRRLQALHFAQRATDDFCRRSEWSWLWRFDTIAIGAGESEIAIPADFSRFGVHGGLFDSTTGTKLREVQLQELEQLRVTGNATLETELCFALGGFDAVTTFCRMVQFPTAGGGMSPRIVYQAIPPVMADNDGTLALCGLEPIPVEYHRPVILAGAVWLSRRSLSDERASEFRKDFETGVAWAIVNDRQTRSSVQRMPRTTPGGMW